MEVNEEEILAFEELKVSEGVLEVLKAAIRKENDEEREGKVRNESELDDILAKSEQAFSLGVRAQNEC
jgi:hypothetical protein